MYLHSKNCWLVLLTVLIAQSLNPFTIDLSFASDANDGITPVVRIAPIETKEVIAEGRAAIGETGVPGARQAATAQALRAAVEKALGVYVSSRTLTQNYQMVRDQVLVRSDGYATLKEIVSENIGTQEVRVTVRALVSLRPLAKHLKAMKLTRAWRIYVESTPANTSSTQASVASDAISALENTLSDAGFVVVSRIKDADITVQIAPRFQKIADIPAETGSFSATMHSIRGDVVARAIRVGTGEVVASLFATHTNFNINADAARSQATTEATQSLAPQLTDALMVLPAAQSQAITLQVSGLKNVTQAAQLEDALNSLTGVQKVTRRGYTNGFANWELDMLTDTVSQLPRAIEQSGALRRFRLSVASENRSRIIAAVR